MKGRGYLLVGLMSLAAACSSSKKSSRILEPVNISAAGTEYRASATMDWDITHTEVSLEFNFAHKTADGTAKIALHPYFYASDKIVLDAKSMDIKKVLVNGQQARVNYKNDSLYIYLNRLYHRTETLQLEITYTAKPYAAPTGGSKAIRSDRGLYFINTDKSIPGKPVQIWSQGETESNSHWVPTFDKPNERFTTVINLTVPDSMVTLGNGHFSGNITDDAGTRTDTWVMDKEIQPYVMMMAIGKYKIVKDSEWRGKEVSYYVEPEYEAYAREIFKNTPEMIEYFSNVTGLPYPWQKYAQVVVRDYVSGAMENTSATIFGEFMNKTHRELMDDDDEDIVSHELFHQWFGDYVTAESWSNLTLNESFATYGEQLWRRYKYGRASAERLGYNDFRTYLAQANKNDEPLVRFHYNTREDMFDRISYQKGASILHYLHGLMGDSAFYQSMKTYLADNALKPAEAHNWRMAVEKVTGKDWNWFFDQWYYRGGHPELDVNYQFDDTKKQVKITLNQKQAKLYRLPFNIQVITGEHVQADMIDMDQRAMTVTYPYYDNSRPAVLVDTDHWIVGQVNDHKTPAHWLKAYKAMCAECHIDKVNALIASYTNLSDTNINELYHLALNDTLEYIREHALNVLKFQTKETVRNSFKKDVLRLCSEDTSRFVKAAALDVVSTWKMPEAETKMFASLRDSSYKVMATALAGLNILKLDTAYALSKTFLAEGAGGDLANQAWQIIGEEGNAADTTLIQQHLYSYGGSKKIVFATALAGYLEAVASDPAFTLALRAIEYQVTSESIAPYRAAMVNSLLDAAYHYKDVVADNNSKANVAMANKRLNEIRSCLLKIEETEDDENNLLNYKNARKDIYGK